MPNRNCPPYTTHYNTRHGDTLEDLARRYGTSLPAILAANPGENPRDMHEGRELCLPRHPYYPGCARGNYYVVRRGDTIYTIAGRNNISIDRLLEANPTINPNTLAIGQVICIPLYS